MKRIVKHTVKHTVKHSTKRGNLQRFVLAGRKNLGLLNAAALASTKKPKTVCFVIAAAMGSSTSNANLLASHDETLLRDGPRRWRLKNHA